MGQQIGRLAMRERKDRWVAFYALDDTMDDAIEIGSMSMSFVGNLERKHAFMDLMQECVADLIESQLGVRPELGSCKTAPAHERQQ